MSKFNVAEMFKGIDKGWVKIFTSKTLLPLLSKVLDALGKAEAITPPPDQIFNFARLTPYGTIKIVILGQDPYPTAGEAHGLAFSSMGKKIPASLRNIYKCLEEQKHISEFPTTANLTSWAKQGVLLLNSALTTTVGAPNAHMAVWKEFTDELIRYISHDHKSGPGDSLIFMLWGGTAHKKEAHIDEDCVIFKWNHPSPLAQVSAPDEDKFINCDHFTLANNLLQEMSLEPICWDPAPLHVIYTDGACSNNGKANASAGYSTYFAKGSFAGQVRYGKVPSVSIDGKMTYGTNQRGEGLGILIALEAVADQKLCANTTIITDSNFWKDMIETYMPNWDMRGVDFKTKKNSDITIKLYDIVNKVKELGTLTIIHVASHDKDPDAPPEHIAGNRIADEYATMAKTLDNYDIQTVNLNTV